jgi:dethiobiotin synthetase
MSALFVTATGTDIGKTYVTRGLIAALRERGRSVAALKPVVTGFDPAEAHGSDSGLLLSALRRPVTPQAIADISPWRFAAPLAPDMAAAREGRALDLQAVIDFCRKAAGANPDALLIEGVGGVMSPMTAHEVVLDWMNALRLPLVLVAGSYLGTISHTLTAIDAIERRELSIVSLVVSETAASPVGLEETRDAIARFAPRLDVVSLPRRSPAAESHAAFDRIAARL